LELQSDLAPSTAISRFVISRYWYQSPWMVILYLSALASLWLLLYRLHHHRLAVQRRRLSIEKERQLHSQLLQAQAEQLQIDVLSKSSQLANSTFNLIRKNETLLQIKEALLRVKAELGDRMPDKYLQRMVRLLDDHLSDEQDWEIFETNFTQVHEVFLKKLKADFPDLTPGDLRLAAYLKMNLSSKEIAPLLNISLRGIENKRYRLRKKLHLENDDNLTSFLMQYG
jgi:DNA-binding CsgD family transcriptional regulator